MQIWHNQSPLAEIGTQADMCIASSKTGTDNISCPWLAVRGSRALGHLSILKDLFVILHFHCKKKMIRSDEGLTLEMSASLSLDDGNSTLVNSFNTKCY